MVKLLLFLQKNLLLTNDKMLISHGKYNFAGHRENIDITKKVHFCRNKKKTLRSKPNFFAQICIQK